MNKAPQIVFDNEHHDLGRLAGEIKLANPLGVTIFMGKRYPHTKPTIDAFLLSLEMPVSGGIFPEVIYGDSYYGDGVIVLLWFDKPEIRTFKNISDPQSELHQHPSALEHDPSRVSCLMIMDMVSGAPEAALDALYYSNGTDLTYAGTGAGYANGGNAPCVFCEEGLIADALQTICLPYAQKTYVGHGWEVLSGPHLVTESEGSHVKSLDYRPIKPHFEQMVKENHPEDVSDLSFDQLISRFPMGIKPYDEDILVRDAMGYLDGAIRYIGDIPVYSKVYLLSGTPDSLLGFVKDNPESFEPNAEESTLSLIFSCVGRRFHMGEHSNTELKSLSPMLKSKNIIVGTSSVGEIAVNKSGLPCLHNMSLVVSRLSI